MRIEHCAAEFPTSNYPLLIIPEYLPPSSVGCIVVDRSRTVVGSSVVVGTLVVGVSVVVVFSVVVGASVVVTSISDVSGTFVVVVGNSVTVGVVSG